MPPAALEARRRAQIAVLREAPYDDRYAPRHESREHDGDGFPPDASVAAERGTRERLASSGADVGGADEVETPPVDAHALGHFVPLDGAREPAMAHFYAALEKLERRRADAAREPEPQVSPADAAATLHDEGNDEASLEDAGANDGPDDGPMKVRIAFYGSSNTAADFLTGYLRSYLQARFGDGGHGYAAMAPPWRTYRHLDVGYERRAQSKHWVTDHAQRAERLDDGLYGLMGASVRADTKGVKATAQLRNGSEASHIELHYLVQPDGGRMSFHIDGKRAARISTKGETLATGVEVFDVEPGAHEMRVRLEGDGEVRLHGLVLENDADGVVLDTLGINGARAANHLSWDEESWADAIGRRDPDLYVLAYGGNEATDEDQPIEVYEAELRLVLERFARTLPESSCLLMGPGDFPRPIVPEPPEGNGVGEDLEIGAVDPDDIEYGPRPRLQAIIETQARVASDFGCAFWNPQAFMGGPLSMNTWVQAEPQMGRPDHLHLSRLGYVRMAMSLTDAIMYGYDAPSDPVG